MKKVNGNGLLIVLSAFSFLLAEMVLANELVVDESGKVGIGTTMPQNALHVHEPTSSYANIQFTNDTTGQVTPIDGFRLGLTSNEDGAVFVGENNALRFGTNNTERMMIGGSGNVGIGRSSSNAKLHVDGKIAWGTTDAYLSTDQGASIELRGNGIPYIDFSNDSQVDYDARIILMNDDWLNINGANVYVDGDIHHKAGIHSVRMTNVPGYLEYHINGTPYAVAITASSIRFKEDIKDLEISSEQIHALNPVSFKWIDERGGKEDFGLVAEDVAETIPALALYDEEGKPFSVRYELLSVLLLKELRLQQKFNTKLTNHLTKLEKRIETLEKYK